MLNALTPNYGSNDHSPFTFGDDTVSQPALECVNMDVSNVGLKMVQNMVIQKKNIPSKDKNGNFKATVPNLIALGWVDVCFS